MPTVEQIKEKLSGAADDLRTAVADRTGEDTAQDGLKALAARMASLVQLNGETVQVRVSSDGGVFQGDPVVLCREFAPGSATLFADGGATKMLDTASAPYAEVNAILYTQAGDTKLKLFRLTTDAGEASLTLGNTVILLEGTALERGTVCLSRDGQSCYVCYELDGDGLMQYVKISPTTLVAVAMGTDIWMDGGDPENIVAACGPERVALCCTRLPEGETQDDAREAVLLTLHVTTDDSNTVTLSIEKEAALTETEYPALHGLSHSKDGYVRGWSIAAYADTVYLTYPKPGGAGRGILVAVMEEGADGYLPMGYTDCPIQGSVPSAHLAEQYTQAPYGVAGGVTLAHGVTRVNDQGQIESVLALELWIRQAGDDRPLLLWAGEEDVRYGASIAMACSGTMGESGGFAGYAMEDHLGGVSNMLGMVIDFREEGAVGGPSVTLGTFGGYGCILPGDETHAAVVYDINGSGYIKSIRRRAVAARAVNGMGDGVAMESGQSGDVIRVAKAI